MPKIDSIVSLDVIYLFDDISSSYGIFNTEICFNCFTYVIYLFDGISTPYGVFNTEISFLCKYFQCSTAFVFLNFTFSFVHKNHMFAHNFMVSSIFMASIIFS